MSANWKEGDELPPLSEMSAEMREMVRQFRANSQDDRPDEIEHYIVCARCGQAIDERSLYQLMHQKESGHEKLTDAELTALAANVGEAAL